MRLAQIHALLHSEPLLIQEGYRASLIELLKDHATLTLAEFEAKREGSTRSGDAVEVDQMETIEGIAHIPIGGPIGRGLGKFEKGAGCVDVEDIRADLDTAEADDSVHGIILDIDSPGGMVTGTPELADRIAAVEKPIYAFTGGLCASAAYWLAASADGIMATRSADIGSIGVYAPFFDTTQAAAMEGVKVKVFTSGKYKGMGLPGTALSTDQEMFMQTRVMEIAQSFYDHVRQHRGEVSDETMQGQVFKAKQAQARGLIDEIVNSKQDVADFLARAA